MLVSIYSDKEPCIIENDKAAEVRCITGEIRNIKFCAGYCSSDSHPGYMTQKMVDEHRCHEKECAFFFENINLKKSGRKTVLRGINVPESLKESDEDEVLKICKTACKNLEGIGIIRADRDKNNNWIFLYVSVCSVDENLLKRKIGKFIKSDFTVKKIECDFDTAVKLVLQS